LCVAWNEIPIGTLPVSDRLLSRWAGLTDDEWVEHKDFIMSAFALKGGRWHQKRMEMEAFEAAEKHRRQSEGGRKGNAKKWLGHSHIAKESVSSPVESSVDEPIGKRSVSDRLVKNNRSDSDRNQNQNHIREEYKEEKSNSIRKAMTLSPSLDTAEFRRAFDEFLTHCEEGGKEKDRFALVRIIPDLERMGPEKAVAAINYSLKRGWFSIREPEEEEKGEKLSSAKPGKKKEYATPVTEEIKDPSPEELAKVKEQKEKLYEVMKAAAPKQIPSGNPRLNGR
jgi:uncharacterized protein YdaU (DUF1376 family)